MIYYTESRYPSLKAGVPIFKPPLSVSPFECPLEYPFECQPP